MDNSIYIALSKQSGAERQLEVIANNIANSSTSGYKGEAMVFSQYLQNGGRGKDAYANDIGTVRDNSQGTLERTGNPLDVAIQGEGYFGIQTPQGERYTRAGNFAVNSNGELVTSEGYQVTDQAGQAITFQPEDQKITIFADGRMEVDGEERNTIGVYTFENPSSLKKAGGNLLSSDQPGTITDEPRIAQGMLENSNVNPIVEMTKMLEVQRDYDRTAKFINSIYDLQETTIRTVGKEG